MLRPPHSTPRILTFNFHEPYLCMMAQTGLPMDIGLYHQGDLARSWQTKFRPKPDNLTEIPESEWRASMMAGKYDLIIAQNEMNAIDVFPAPCPKLLVCHNRRTFLKSTARIDEGDPIHSFSYLLKRLVEVFQFIFISESKRDDYGIPGRVILPGIDVEKFGGYTGETPCVLRVGNMMQPRNWMFDVPFQDVVCQGLPHQVVGINPGIPESKPADSYEELLRAYRSNRCLLHVTRQEFEDGYNLSTLEAMACGMPVVSLANRTSPITDGVDGFVSFDAPTLRRRLQELLENPDLAGEIGAKGRETAARKFPMERFVERWREAIFEAIEQRPPAPEWRPNPIPPRRKSILMHYVSSPLTTGRYLELAAQKQHDICTAGFHLPQPVLELWGFKSTPPPYPLPRVPTPFDAPYSDVLAHLPRGYQADFYLFVDSGPHEISPDITLLKLPKVAYLIDTHVSPGLRLAMARNFDIVFLAQKGQIESFREAGIRNIFWLPLACSPELHCAGELERIHDVSYVGSFSSEEGDRRNGLLQNVARRFPNHVIGRFWPEEMARIYAQSKIVVNASFNRDVNMRVFEALASGALLITDEAEGLEDLFEDGVHLVIYRRDEDLPALIEQYLNDDAARERIARAGRELVFREHTYEHRMDLLTDTVVSTLTNAGGNEETGTEKVSSYYQHARRELLPFISYYARRVLDVGCGAGALGHLLKQERAVEEVAGIELSAEAAGMARRMLDQVVVGNLEDIELPFADGYFDCIICADILEHLQDPAAILRKLSRVLAPDGTLVISIPNIQFHDTLSMLSLGCWSYADAGILDRTHLRFFTRTTLRKLVHSAGLEVAELSPLNMRAEERFPRNPDGSLTMGKLTIRDLTDAEYEDFLVYQYVVIACHGRSDPLALARKALAAGYYEMALENAREKVEADDFERRIIMAKALTKMGRLEEAEKAYCAALRIRGDNEVKGAYGILLVGMNRLDDAKPFLEEVLAEEPNQDRIQGALGLVLLAQGKYEEAYHLLLAALEGSFEHISLIRPFASICETLDRLPDAEQLIGKFTEFYPGNLDLICVHAEVLLKIGGFGKAREMLETAQLLDPRNIRVQELVAEISAKESR